MFVAALAALSSASTELSVKVDGEKQAYWLSPTDEASGSPDADGTALRLSYGQRFYLMSTPKAHSSSQREDFKQLYVKGKMLNVSIDLQGASCGCNVAFYLVSMPSTSGPGQANDYYCDANNVGGEACPELDLIEANVNGLHTTLHECTKPYSKSTCNGAGNGVRFGQGDKDFGEGSDFKVDTSKPFTASFHLPFETALTRSPYKSYSPREAPISLQRQ